MSRKIRISAKRRGNPNLVCTKCETSLSMWKEEKILIKRIK